MSFPKNRLWLSITVLPASVLGILLLGLYASGVFQRPVQAQSTPSAPSEPELHARIAQQALTIETLTAQLKAKLPVTQVSKWTPFRVSSNDIKMVFEPVSNGAVANFQKLSSTRATVGEQGLITLGFDYSTDDYKYVVKVTRKSVTGKDLYDPPLTLFRGEEARLFVLRADIEVECLNNYPRSVK